MKKRFLAYAALFALPLLGTAQRLVLVEHFTQASCPPCASLNPALTALINNNSDKVIAIKYQTSWPGTDPMNAMNPSDVQGRVNYYNVSGVPNSVVNGNNVNSPTNVTQALINTQSAGTEGVKTNVTFRVIDKPGALQDSMVVTAKVRANTALPAGRVLHVVAIEREIQFTNAPGTNGESKFEWVMKKMFPSSAGTTLPAMAPGDSMTYNFKWSTYRAASTNQSFYYNIANAAAVGFVQNNSTKEVLGSGYDEPKTNLSTSMPASEKPVKMKGEDEVQYSFNAISKVEENQQINVVASGTNLPQGWTLSIIADGNTYPATALIPLPGNSQKTITLKVSGPNAAVLNKKYALKVELNSTTILPDNKKTINFTAITPANILFLDFAGTATSRFGLAFQAAGQPSVNLTPDETKSLAAAGLVPSAARKIYYSTGGASSSVLPNSLVDAFTSYLEAGGNLFAMGQDIGYSTFDPTQSGTVQAKEFYNNYLGASYVSDGPASSLEIARVSTDTVMAPPLPASISITGSTSSSPDRIEPFAGSANAKAFLTYSTGGKAGVYNFGDNWKSVYLAFRMEAVGSTGANLQFRNAIVARSNAWFDNTITSNQLLQDLAAFGPAYPNPAQDRLVVPVASGKGKVVLQDVSGRQVLQSGFESARNGNLELSLQGIPAGVYFLVTQAESVSVPVQKIVIR